MVLSKRDTQGIAQTLKRRTKTMKEWKVLVLNKNHHFTMTYYVRAVGFYSAEAAAWERYNVLLPDDETDYDDIIINVIYVKDCKD